MNNINKQLCGSLQPSVCLWTATRAIWSKPGTHVCLELLAVVDAWLVSIFCRTWLVLKSVTAHDVQFETVFVDLLTYNVMHYVPAVIM